MSAVAPVLRDIIARTGPEAAARIVEIYFGLDLRPRLGEIGVPAMIVHGVLDALSPSALDDAEELAAALHAELHLLGGAGHLPLLSRPDDVSRLLDRFLATCYDREGAAQTGDRSPPRLRGSDTRQSTLERCSR